MPNKTKISKASFGFFDAVRRSGEKEQVLVLNITNGSALVYLHSTNAVRNLFGKGKSKEIRQYLKDRFDKVKLIRKGRF
jgi:hypothetical protein